jgi:hypothetical protein
MESNIRNERALFVSNLEHFLPSYEGGEFPSDRFASSRQLRT